MQDIHKLVDALKLAPHPEGGFYREVHRSKTIVADSKGSGDKSAYTSIYYLLSGKDFSAWHRIKSDETWYFHLGCDVVIYFFDENKLLILLSLYKCPNRLCGCDLISRLGLAKNLISYHLKILIM
jgi:predicted cupin superfamily sugar epimerase